MLSQGPEKLRNLTMLSARICFTAALPKAVPVRTDLLWNNSLGPPDAIWRIESSEMKNQDGGQLASFRESIGFAGAREDELLWFLKTQRRSAQYADRPD
jgi:hypothetical protein